MRVHLQFNSNNPEHSHMTLFVNGKNNGGLVMSPEEAIWFHHILEQGCAYLSPKGHTPIEFIASGEAPDPPMENMDAVVKEK